MTEPNPSPRLPWSLRWRLSLLWFLQFAVWGSWFTYAPRYLDKIDITPTEQGFLFASMSVALWLAPVLAGQVADRWFATQHALAVSHALGGVLLLLMASVREFWGLLILAPLYATAYIPTWALASSLTFRHLPDRDRQFGGIRLWATFGWVLAGWALGAWLRWGDRVIASESGLVRMVGWSPPEDADCFRQAALLSFVLAAFCLYLPHTPPQRESRQSLAILPVLAMLRDRQFAFFIVVCFLLAAALPIYFLTISPFLSHLGIADHWIAPTQTLGQASEIPALLLLPWALRTLGVKGTLTVGIAAWTLRFFVFSIGWPVWFVIAAIGLHGLCHVFVLIVAQLHVDSQCRADVRASAQNFLAVLAFGIGMPVGFALAGMLRGLHTTTVASSGTSPSDIRFHTDYHSLFLMPAVALGVVLMAFWVGFRRIGPSARGPDNSL